MPFFKRNTREDTPEVVGETLVPGTMFPSMDLFLTRKPERGESQQVEYGIMWRDGERKRPRYRVAWLEETGEVIAEALSEFEHLRTIELLGTVTSRDTLELALNGWERLEYGETTLEWVRGQIARSTPGGGVADATAKPTAAEQAPVEIWRTA